MLAAVLAVLVSPVISLGQDSEAPNLKSASSEPSITPAAT
jgi:hypothetical protein